MSNRDRRKMQRDERRARSKSATRLTSSTDPMDTDETERITRNILLRTQVRQGRGASSDGEDTVVGSDLERTVVEKKTPIKDAKKTHKKKPDNTRGIRNPEPMETPTERPAVNASSIFKGRKSQIEPPIRLTFDISPSLESMNQVVGAVGGTTHETESEDRKGKPEYVDNDFYLPLPGYPLLSSLDPERTDQLTLRGNRAKLVRIGPWAPIYTTSKFMVDDQTGEIYAIKGNELPLIREYGVLNEEEAKEQFLKNSPVPAPRTTSVKQEPTESEMGTIPKKATETDSTHDKELEQIRQRYREEQRKYHLEALKDYKQCRQARKDKEEELIKMKATTQEDRIPTKTEMEKTRLMIEKEYQKYLVPEREALKKYYDHYPSDLNSDEDEVKSQTSMDSYQAEDSWTEEKYRKLLFKYKRIDAHYPILQHARDISIQRHPENPTLYNKELSEAREMLDK